MHLSHSRIGFESLDGDFIKIYAFSELVFFYEIRFLYSVSRIWRRLDPRHLIIFLRKIMEEGIQAKVFRTLSCVCTNLQSKLLKTNDQLLELIFSHMETLCVLHDVRSKPNFKYGYRLIPL